MSASVRPGESRARLIHAHQASSRIDDGHQGGNRVQGSGNEASFDGQRALGALARSLGLLLQADAAVQFEARDGLAREDFKQREVFRPEAGQA